MKKILTLLSCSALAILAFAENAAPKPAPADAAKKDSAAAPMIPASKAQVTAPLALKDDAISQPAQTELADGGKAVFTISVPKDGNYVIHAVVNAPSEDANSFFLNIDAKPEDPLMIWDIDVTTGFEERVVSWRGNGDASSDEFSPKVFKLTAGEHKVNIVGREPAFLKSISVRPAKS
ncbi:MAG TPA: hypothetical protein VHO24_07675 [Opitutaceae bacterium]|nr:hypothetical protein [Opitutaceae bacterium]